MEEKKTQLNNLLVRVASWIYNTNVNKLGYTPQQLVSQKSCNLPGLTIGNKASESVLETEVVHKFIERLIKTGEKFRKAEMRTKLKDCQGVKVRGYQQQEKYLEGDKVWY